jgi:hypothetical protein
MQNNSSHGFTNTGVTAHNTHSLPNVSTNGNNVLDL